MELKRKSLKLNMVLNAIKGLMGIVFPLITFPYISSTLGVENLGRYNFANSIISYFVLFAGLGINTYAIREGARIREKHNKIEHFSKEILSINFCSTALSYIVFFFLLLMIPKLYDYKILLIIFSLQIMFKTIGVEWIYSIYEDYIYITIRSIAFQVISLILLLLLVKNENHLNIYAMITVFSGVGSNVLNYVHSRKYCKVSIVRHIKWKKHLKPIIILFATSATVTLYVSSDVTILGFLCDDYTVGIYSVSIKVYSIIKTMLSSILVVSVPRLSALLGEDDKISFNATADDIYKTLITLVLPVIVGIIVLKKEIVLLLSSEEYLSATSALALLSVALFFCMGAWFWGQCILVPFKMENTLFKVTIVSALVNIILNFALIPLWKENAAAITTIIAECISFVWCSIVGRKQLLVNGLMQHYLKVIFGCFGIAGVGLIVHMFEFSNCMSVLLIIAVSVVLYVFIEIGLNNESVKNVIHLMIKKRKAVKRQYSAKNT